MIEKPYIDYLAPMIQDFVRDGESLSHPDIKQTSVVEQLEVVVYANLQRATRLHQSIFQKAYTGEILHEYHKK